MARYIDAEALTDSMLEHYNELCEKYGDYDHYTTGYGDAIDAIENAPTADVVPKADLDEAIKNFMDAQDKVIAEAVAEDVRNIISDIDDRLHDMAMEYHNAGHPEYFAVCEMVHHKVISAVEKKYTDVTDTNVGNKSKVVDAIIEKEISHTKGGG